MSNAAPDPIIAAAGSPSESVDSAHSSASSSPSTVIEVSSSSGFESAASTHSGPIVAAPAADPMPEPVAGQEEQQLQQPDAAADAADADDDPFVVSEETWPMVLRVTIGIRNSTVLMASYARTVREEHLPPPSPSEGQPAVVAAPAAAASAAPASAASSEGFLDFSDEELQDALSILAYVVHKGGLPDAQQGAHFLRLVKDIKVAQSPVKRTPEKATPVERSTKPAETSTRLLVQQLMQLLQPGQSPGARLEQFTSRLPPLMKSCIDYMMHPDTRAEIAASDEKRKSDSEAPSTSLLSKRTRSPDSSTTEEREEKKPCDGKRRREDYEGGDDAAAPPPAVV